MPSNKIVILLALTWLLQACVAANPQPSQDERASAVNVQLGLGYLQQNNLELANEKLAKALRQDPNSADAHNAYAILQERLLQLDTAEFHYSEAVRLDPSNSLAANNYGAFLCRNGREAESEKYFLMALENPLYKTPEFAYTNAAVCLLKIDQQDRAKEYLRKALAARSTFGDALLVMGDLSFKQSDFANARLYMQRYHQVAPSTARSLWLAIRTELELGGAGSGTIERLGKELEEKFVDSDEYREWRQIR
ncbi:MAG: type IV pilus biogenesis/stability protein PilW [Gammaproteobacteria bacterium]|nr:type IV pilus biogenesis/stability protein PilW [Gammaproteobacteria bacterium]